MNPALGRWTEPDKAGIDESPNAYLFANLGPTNLRDPYGLQAEQVIPGLGTAYMGWVVYHEALKTMLTYFLRLALVSAFAEGTIYFASRTTGDSWMELFEKLGVLDMLSLFKGPGNFETCLIGFINCLILAGLRPGKCPEEVPSSFEIQDFLFGVLVGTEIQKWDACLDRFEQCMMRGFYIP